MHARALTGMAIGASTMVFFGAIWLLVGAYLGRPLRQWARGALIVTGLVLMAATGLAASRALRLSHTAPPLTTEESAVGQQIGHRFGWITGLEGGAIFLAVVVLKALHRPTAILPIVAIIVGLHFIPLAGLFGAPLYYATGAIGCIVGVIGLLIGDPRLRASFVGLSVGILLWVTACVVLLQEVRFGLS